MTRYYSRKGDDGTTSWIGKGRLKKYDLRFEALGSVDETSASLGLARGLSGNAQVKDILLHVQRDLSGMMGEVAADMDQAERFRTVRAEQVAWLESQTDTITEMVESPRSFLMSGDTPGGGALDLARAVTRRAERRVVEMTDEGSLNNPFINAYLNRLSSLLFVLELLELKTCCPDSPSEAK
jgi:cob(I)alamin adenosyltransferase